MQKMVCVLLIALMCLAAQILCLQIFGTRWVPNFVLISVVFFNLYRGMRYSLGAAFAGGFLLDSFGGGLLGINVFSLVMCAFLTGSLKMYIYQPGVPESRGVMVFFIVVFNGLLQFFLQLMFGVDLRFSEALWNVFIPQTVLTLFVTSFTFARLKECVLKLFV